MVMCLTRSQASGQHTLELGWNFLPCENAVLNLPFSLHSFSTSGSLPYGELSCHLKLMRKMCLSPIWASVKSVWRTGLDMPTWTKISGMVEKSILIWFILVDYFINDFSNFTGYIFKVLRYPQIQHIIHFLLSEMNSLFFLFHSLSCGLYFVYEVWSYTFTSLFWSLDHQE